MQMTTEIDISDGSSILTSTNSSSSIISIDSPYEKRSNLEQKMSNSSISSTSSDNIECFICMERVLPDGSLPVDLTSITVVDRPCECRGNVHTACYAEWIHRDRSCPVCREPIQNPLRRHSVRSNQIQPIDDINNPRYDYWRQLQIAQYNDLQNNGNINEINELNPHHLHIPHRYHIRNRKGIDYVLIIIVLFAVVSIIWLIVLLS